MTASSDAPVTTVVARAPRSGGGDPDEVVEWANQGQLLLATFPGYLGGGWVYSPSARQWQMFYRFESAGALARWEASDERARWLRAGAAAVVEAGVHRRTGWEEWFLPRPETSPPPRWKQLVSIVIAFYPLSLGANLIVSSLLASLPIWLRVLVVVVLVSPIMVYFAMPFVTRVLAPWMRR